MPRDRARATYAALAAADTMLAGTPRLRRARLLTKPLLMPALAATLWAGDRRDPSVRRTLSAQALCWGGDVALMGAGRRSFLAGLGSFFAAHLAYVSAFRSRTTTPLLGTASGRSALAAGAVLAPAMGLAAWRRDPRVAAPVAAYGVLLTTMVAASAAVPPERGRSRILAGTSLFLLSDTLIGLQEFVLSQRSAKLESAVMATYTAGQWLISEGVTSS